MSNTEPSRRRFLRRATVAAGNIAAGSPLVALAADTGTELTWRGVRRLIRPGRAFLPQSVTST